MSQLRLCGSCDRHVRDGDDVCPFCGEADLAAPRGRRPASRLSRAKYVAFGVAVAAAAATGCGDGAGDSDAGPPDAGDIAAPYGAPPIRGGDLV